MTKYREILRLKSLGFSERNIAQSCGVSRNTVAKVLKKAAEINLSWPLDFDMTDSALEKLFVYAIPQKFFADVVKVWHAFIRCRLILRKHQLL